MFDAAQAKDEMTSLFSSNLFSSFVCLSYEPIKLSELD
jgi:hypothetical protein